MAASLGVPVSAGVKSKFTPGSVSSIAKLTEGLAAGKEDAFREFYDRYSHRLFGFLYVVCGGNGEQARELLQQTMIKVARYAKVFEEEEVLWKWLTMLGRSSWVDESRKRMRYLAALKRLWDGKEMAPAPPDDDGVRIIMEKSLELLSEYDRSLLVKKYVDGMSVREMAAWAECSEKAIESQLTRARNRMKEIVATLKRK